MKEKICNAIDGLLGLLIILMVIVGFYKYKLIPVFFILFFALIFIRFVIIPKFKMNKNIEE